MKERERRKKEKDKYKKVKVEREVKNIFIRMQRIVAAVFDTARERFVVV